MQKEDIGEPV